MGTFNPKALADYTKSIKDKAKGGETRVFDQRDLKENEPVDIRLLKPLANQGGEWKYFVETTTYWINNKPFMANTFNGGADVIAEEVEEARAMGDPTVDELLDSEDFRIKVGYYMPIRIVQVELDEDSGEIASVKVTPKKDIFSCTPSLADQINDIVCNPKYIAGRNGNGVFDPEKGNSITISKTGQKLNTKYKAMIGDQFAMPEQFADPAKTPDVMAYLKKMSKSDEYLRAAIRNYLYGEELPEKDIWKEEAAQDAEPAEEKVTKPAPAAKATGKPAAKPATTGTVKPAAKPAAKKSLADSLDALDDE